MSQITRAHAGSPASPLMSEALMSARDAVTGYWDGLPGFVSPPDLRVAIAQNLALGLEDSAVRDMTEEEFLAAANLTPADLRAAKQTALADAAVTGLKLPADDTYLERIKSSSQGKIADTLLKSRVQFTGSDGTCSVMAGNDTLITLDRPPELTFVKQLDWVRAYADLRGDRVAEIFLQLDDMVSFYGAQAYLDSGRRKYTLAMLDLARSFSTHIEIPAKYYCRAIRPVDMAVEVQPMIQTPDHSSFPSGHSTEAFAMATVFYRLMTGKSAAYGVAEMAMPFRLAHRIAVNRTVAGVHYPVDSRAGAYLGCLAGEYFYALAQSGEVAPVTFDAGGVEDDFLLSNFDLAAAAGVAVQVQPDPVVGALWNKAQAEWPHV